VHVALNWLWQGGVVALATACALWVIPLSRTRARYCTAWAACAAVLALPAIPLVWAAASPEASRGVPATGVPIMSMPDDWWTSTAIAFGMWAVWVAVQGIRAVVATAALRRAKTACRVFPPQLEARLAHWTRVSATGRRARLVLSDRVRAAAVLGGASPLIAVARPLLDHLDHADLDRIVVHEWAHVQRRDDIVQAVQLLVRIVAGWHPAIWWLERQLHLEREVACDETVVAVTGSPKEYASCLTELARLPAAQVRWSPALAAIAPSGLRSRVVRILKIRQAVARPWRATAVMSAMSVGVVAFSVGNLTVFDTARSSPTVLGAAAVNGVRIIAPPVPIAAPAIPQGLAPGRATPTRALALARGGSATGKRAATRMTEAAAGPVRLEPETSAVAATTVRSVTQPLAAVTLDPRIRLATLGPPTAPANGTGSPGSLQAADDSGRAIWGAAADAGKAIGRGSEAAAVETAAFFTRFGRSVAGSF
jgi:bla regulator protein blaR1